MQDANGDGAGEDEGGAEADGDHLPVHHHRGRVWGSSALRARTGATSSYCQVPGGLHVTSRVILRLTAGGTPFWGPVLVKQVVEEKTEKSRRKKSREDIKSRWRELEIL